MKSDFQKFIYSGFKKELPKVIQESPKTQETLLDNIFENIQTCNVNQCSSQNINKTEIDNLLNKKYVSIGHKFINEIIDILNKKIKDKIIEMLKDNNNKDLIEKLNKINIKHVSAFTKGTLILNKKEYIEQIKDSLCTMNNYEKIYKIQFSQLLSKTLCEIKSCINHDETFEKIKEMVYENIKDMFNNCKKNI